MTDTLTEPLLEMLEFHNVSDTVSDTVTEPLLEMLAHLKTVCDERPMANQ